MHQPKEEPRSQADPGLVARAVAGDRAARGRLFDDHGGLVYGLCRRMAPHEAEDAAQAVWEKVFRALHRFDPEGAASLRSWIGTVTRRHLIDMHRRGGTRGEVIELGEMASATPSIDARLDAAKQAARLEVALTKLPEAQRRAVVFHHLQGQALDTLAEEEGVAVGTLKSRLHRGRARLAQLLGAKR